MQSCLQCNSSNTRKNGLVRGKQRWLCKDCHRNFTLNNKRDKPQALRLLAISLVGLGLSFRAVALSLGLSPNTVCLWFKQFGELALLPEPEVPPEVIELDEMWHFVQSKKEKSGSGRQWILLPASFSTSKWVAVALPH